MLSFLPLMVYMILIITSHLVPSSLLVANLIANASKFIDVNKVIQT